MTKNIFILIFFFISETHLYATKKKNLFFFLNSALGYEFSQKEKMLSNNQSQKDLKTSQISLNISTGIIWRYALLGFKYYELNFKSSNLSDLDNTQDKFSSFGSSLGFRHKSFQMTYSKMGINNSQKKIRNQGEYQNYTIENGFILDLSLLFGYKKIKFGPQISMINFQFKEKSKNSEIKYFKTKKILPFILFSLEF